MLHRLAPRRDPGHPCPIAHCPFIIPPVISSTLAFSLRHIPPSASNTRAPTPPSGPAIPLNTWPRNIPRPFALISLFALASRLGAPGGIQFPPKFDILCFNLPAHGRHCLEPRASEARTAEKLNNLSSRTSPAQGNGQLPRRANSALLTTRTGR